MRQVATLETIQISAEQYLETEFGWVWSLLPFKPRNPNTQKEKLPLRRILFP
jgi:hypothetical protein